MDSYLVKRLRDLVGQHIGDADIDDELSGAADRIEKLEAALREIIDIHPFKDPEGDVSVKSLVDLVFHINLNARKALEGKDD